MASNCNPPSIAADSECRLRMAVCICTRNRALDLRGALASVQASTVRPHLLVVSDDSDADCTSEVARVCEEVPGVTYVRGPRRGLGANRNRCLEVVQDSADYIVFIDDDARLSPDFLATGAEILEASRKPAILTGREMKNGLEVTPHNLSFLGHQERDPRSLDDYHSIVINSTIFPSSLFQIVRFDEALRYGSDEIDVCGQAEHEGFRIVYVPRLINEHHPSPINRAEYRRHEEASRLYSTYKRYRWLEGNRTKASAYAVVAPLHLAASACKTHGLVGLLVAWHAVRFALLAVIQERVRRGSAGVGLG